MDHCKANIIIGKHQEKEKKRKRKSEPTREFLALNRSSSPMFHSGVNAFVNPLFLWATRSQRKREKREQVTHMIGVQFHMVEMRN